MSIISVVYPHQLFEDHPAISKMRDVWMVEDDLFFNQYKFHKQKLILHRASMKYYESKLKENNLVVKYIDALSAESSTKMLFKLFKESGITEIHYCDPVDYLLNRRLTRYARLFKIKLVRYESPNFICSEDYIQTYFANKKRFHQTDFYVDQRKRFNILLDDGQPLGGKWSYDTENRNKLPKGVQIPPIDKLTSSTQLDEAIEYVETNFSANYGSSKDFIYPITHRESEKWFEHFLEQRFINYGTYQDAIVEDETFLFHSVISPMLNVGLLNPLKIIDKAIENTKLKEVPLNCIEGFVRQILGWREYIRAIYVLKGTQQRNTNYLNHHQSIGESFYNGTTGINPVDASIKRTLKFGYAHHIERLMLLGNLMLLCRLDPDQVYQWFMEMYIDAYDWVMVPNVYGMSQFADGGLMSTKPYISGSNYVLKMSNFKTDNWASIWDALYWCFIFDHRDFFSKNPRMSMMVHQVNKMSDEKILSIQTISRNFIKQNFE